MHDKDNFISFLGISETWISDNHTLENWIRHSVIGQNYTITTDFNTENQPNTTSRGAGTALIVHKSWTPFRHKTHRYNGRITAIEFKRLQKHYLFGTVYLPSAPSPNDLVIKPITTFLSTVLRTLPPTTHIILGGDWNIAPAPMDRYSSYATAYAEPTRQIINRLTSPNQQNRLMDIWRFLHPAEEDYTHLYTSLDNRVSQARLDFHLISPTLLPHVLDSTIDSDTIWDSHHKAIRLTLTLPTTRQQLYFSKQKSNALRYNKHDLTTDHIDALNIAVSQNQELQSQLKTLRTYNSTLTPLEPNKHNSIDQTLTKVIQSAVRTHLPIKSQKQQPRPRYQNKETARTSKFLLKNHRTVCKIRATLRRYPHQPILDEDYDSLAEIGGSLEMDILQYTNHTKLCNDTLKHINKQQKTLKENQIKKRIKERTSTFYQHQKKYIKSIFEDSSPWDGANYIQDPISKHIITDPKLVKLGLKSFYQTLFSPSAEQITLDPRLSQSADWTQRLAPLQTIDETWYAKLMSPITASELLNTIKKLPANSSPGPNGISYNIYKLLTHQDIIDYMLESMNHTLQHGTFPSTAANGTIILLAKINNWQGQLDKLRPITLLESHRKILTKILTARLTLILDSHEILKGHNFGFRRNKSTADSLSILRDIIDDAKLNNKPLYMALLDIQKAYDTVPFRALEKTLSRLKIPPLFIQLIKSIDKNRTLNISTPHGTTDTFTPLQGIPQGDSLSPILWAIFYDPLLCHMQNQGLGYTLHNSNVTIAATAYANDLLPIASSTKDLQSLLDTTFTFLNFFNMKMNASKSMILNNDKLTTDPSPNPLSLNTDLIQTLIPKNTATRILGVYWSLDGNSTRTFSLAMTELNKALNKIKIRFLPGNLVPHLINTVIIPKIAYRLQLIPLSHTQIETVNRTLRTLVRQGNSLPRTMADSFLYDTRLGTDLQDFRPLYEGSIVTTLLKKLRSPDSDITKQCTIANLQSVQRKTRLPLLPTIAPLPSSPIAKTNLGMYASTILYKHNLRLRSHTDISTGGTSPLAMILSHANYPAAAQGITKFALHTLDSVQNRTHPNRMVSFATIVNRLPKKRKEHLQNTLETTPQFFQLLQMTLSHDTTPLPQLENLLYDAHILHPIAQPLRLTAQIPTLPTQDIQIWTDGSLKHERMGAGIIFVTPTMDNQPPHIMARESTRLSKAPTQTSSTRPELFAIYRGLISCATETTISIFTDSQSAINNILTSLLPLPSLRKQITTPNYAIIDAIAHEMLRFQTRPTLTWVKGHNGSEFNEAADTEAKKALTLPTTHDIDMSRLPVAAQDLPYLYHNGIRLEQDPRKHISRASQTAYRNTTTNRLNRRWSQIFPTPIDWDLTLQNIRGYNRTNVLDNTFHRKERFRLLTFTRELQTLAKVQHFRRNQQNPALNPRCQRCLGHYETNDHIWTCPDSIRILPMTNLQLKDLLTTEWQHHKQWHALQVNPPLTEAIVLISQELLNTTDPPFLLQPEARGLITEQTINKTKRLLRVHFHHSKKSRLITRYIIHCWLEAFYSTAWRHRNQCTFQPLSSTTHFFTNPQPPPSPEPPPSRNTTSSPNYSAHNFTTHAPPNAHNTISAPHQERRRVSGDR